MHFFSQSVLSTDVTSSSDFIRANRRRVAGISLRPQHAAKQSKKYSEEYRQTPEENCEKASVIRAKARSTLREIFSLSAGIVACYTCFFIPASVARSNLAQLPVLPSSPAAEPSPSLENSDDVESVGPPQADPSYSSSTTNSGPNNNEDDIIHSRYLLDTGDRVRVDVFNAEDYSGEFSVLAGGVVNVPLAGEILVEGLTLQQASDVISTQLSQYVRRPRVTISLLSARPFQVAIAGAVNRPGAYTLPTQGNDATSTPTLTQLISLAGGITQSADIRNINVQREQSRIETTTATSAAKSSVEVNLWQLLQAGELNADLPLQHGDRIVIPEATALTPADSVALASASFSPDTITVNVVGEVKSPGAISVPPNAPLNQALLTAGGLNNRANDSVSLIRLNSNGSVTQQAIDVNFESGISQEDNPSLRPNDTIVVGTNGLSRVTDTLGNVLSPLNSGFGLLRLFGL
ncbi:MAG: SLBB domain-containing protein [Cyanobacteria bacterium J06634_5]